MTNPIRPSGPSVREENAIEENETYHLLVDADLERRLIEMGWTLSAPGGDAARVLGIDERPGTGFGYRLVVDCSVEDNG